MATAWQQLSKEISEVVEGAGKSVVAVDGRSGHTSSGIVWRRDLILTAAHAIRHDGISAVIFGPGRSGSRDSQAETAGRILRCSGLARK